MALGTGDNMKIRLAEEKDYLQLAKMKWIHLAEDDVDYGEHNLEGADRHKFIDNFVDFLYKNQEYKIFIAEEKGKVISAMFVYVIPKTPSPRGKSKYIAYLTNVFTLKEYRSQGIGTEILCCIKDYLKNIKCELIFAWSSDNSVKWYVRNDFYQENEVFECNLMGE